jgi:hypothetical protein
VLKNSWYYHSHIRNAIIAFGMLFNTITVKRINNANAIAQSIKVPIAYGPKQKFIARIGAAPDLSKGRAPFEVVVPMMSFEIASLAYDPDRKLPPMQTVRAINPAGGVKQGYSWTPYNIGINMSVLVKNQDDGLQIVEQILPYFAPDFNVVINELPDLGVKHNIRFILNSVNLIDDYEGDFSKRLYVQWDLNFTVQINLFGFIADVGLIREVIQNLYADDGLINGVNSQSEAGEQIITSVSPFDADPSGDYTYVQEFNTIFFAPPTTTTKAPTTTTTIPPTIAPTTTTIAP